VILLKGFQRVHLPAGGATQVTFEVGPRQLAILDRQMKWNVETGEVELRIGDSSTQTISTTLAVK
jgi:beta-glucosidase